LLANSTEQSSSGEANMSSASQEIPRILCNPKVNYRIHNSQSRIPILSQDQSSPCPPTPLAEDPF